MWQRVANVESGDDFCWFLFDFLIVLCVWNMLLCYLMLTYLKHDILRKTCHDWYVLDVLFLCFCEQKLGSLIMIPSNGPHLHLQRPSPGGINKLFPKKVISLGFFSPTVPRYSMYGMFTYIYPPKLQKCREIYAIHSAAGVIKHIFFGTRMAYLPTQVHQGSTNGMQIYHIWNRQDFSDQSTGWSPRNGGFSEGTSPKNARWLINGDDP